MRNRYSALCTLHSAFCTRRLTAGQALVEYAIVFPLQLLLTLIIIQLAHLFVAKQVVEYSAFCAARAGLSNLDDYDGQRRAALVPLSRISGKSGVAAQDSIVVPGWGALPGSAAADQKTSVTVRPDTVDGYPVVFSEVTHEYELSIPIGGAVVYKLGDVTPGLEVDRSTYDAPHWVMSGTCVLARPWGE